MPSAGVICNERGGNTFLRKPGLIHKCKNRRRDVCRKNALRTMISGPIWPGAYARRAAEATLKPQPPDHPDRFPNDLAGHFGVALKSVGENDRHFQDFHTFAPQLVGHLDLKTVAIGADVVKVDGLERAAAKTFVTARGVGNRHA